MTDISHIYPRDARISFDEEKHEYTIDESFKLASVTTFVHSIFEEFDPDEVIDTILTRGSKKYAGMTREEIKISWEKKRDEAATKGTELHKLIEDVYNGVRTIPSNSRDPAIVQFSHFKSDHPHLQPYRAEWVVFDTDIKLAGSVDMVFRDEAGYYHIYDWKRTPKLWRNRPFENYCKVMDMDHIPNTNYWHYSLQLNLYRTILERSYGIKIKTMKLVCMHPNLPNYEVHTVASMDDEVSVLFPNNNSLKTCIKR